MGSTGRTHFRKQNGRSSFRSLDWEVARLQPLIDFLIKEVDRSESRSNNKRDRSRNRQHSRDRNQNNGRGSSNQNGTRHGQGQNTDRQPQPGTTKASNNNQRSRTNNEGAVGGTQRVKSQVQKVDKCYICDLQHRCYLCPTFNGIPDRAGRLNKLKERKLCANCMKPNCSPSKCTLKECPNGCGEKHNRLVCPLTFASTVNVAQQANENAR